MRSRVRTMSKNFTVTALLTVFMLPGLAPLPELLTSTSGPQFGLKAEVVERVVAVVGNEVITLSELNELVNAMHGQTLAAISDLQARSAQRRELQKTLLDQMIEQRLMTQQYTKLNITASEQDVDRVVEAILKQNNITIDVLTSELDRQGLSMSQYRDQMRQHVLQTRFIEQQIRPKVNITEEDIKNLYTQKIGEVQGEEVAELTGIVVGIPRGGGPEAVEQSRKQAKAMADALRSGKTPDELALAAADGSVISLGSMGSFRKGELMAELDAAIAPLKTGEVTDPVESAQGLYIIKVINKGVQTSVKPYAELRDQLYRRLYDQQTELHVQAFLRTARKETHVEVLL